MSVLAFAARSDRRLVVALSAPVFLLWTGGSSILPLLPVFLRRHGSSPVLVGATMASYFAASVLTQFPVGRLADRLGCVPIIVAGFLAFAIGSCGFAVESGPLGAIAFRALQGAASGAVTVAAAALVARRIPLAEQGRAFGALYGAQMLALAIGPLLGTIFGLAAMRELFVVAAVIALVALGPILSVVRPLAPDRNARARRVRPVVLIETQPSGTGHAFAPGGSAGAPRLIVTPALIGAALSFAAMGVLAGAYESCWTLLLRRSGASAFDIGLSWTLFALPFAVLSIPAGRLAERYDRRLLVCASVAASGVFAIVYPFLHVVGLLVGLGSLEAIAAAVASPGTVLVVTSSTPPDQQGQAQGAIETARTAATAGAAAASGALFGTAAVLPFAIAFALVLAMAAGIAWCWRDLPRAVSGERLVAPRSDTAGLQPRR